jgi:hypothetical protein
MESPTVSTSQKRKPSLSQASTSTKRRSVSISIKVTHETTPEDRLGSPDLPIVPKNPQACLNGLPEEILLKVMETVTKMSNAYIRELPKFCLTNKRCKRIAEVVMHKKIYSTAGSYMHAQAETIASNPLLAKHVREISVLFGHTPDPKDWPGEQIVDEGTMRKVFTKILTNAHGVQTLYLTEDVDGPIKRDELAHTLGWLELMESAVASPMRGDANRFDKLKTLTLSSDSQNLSVGDISCVFRLPSLETLKLGEIYQTTAFEEWSVLDSSSSIRNLYLENVMVDITAVTQMLLMLKALHIFRYHRSTIRWEPFAAKDNPLSVWPEHSWKLLGDALRRHGDSLETVHAIDDSDQDILDLVYPDGQEVNTLGSFRDCPRLKRFHVPMEALLVTGENDLSCYLPSQLEEFGTKITQAGSRLLVTSASALVSLQYLADIRHVIVELEKGVPLRSLDLTCGLAVLKAAEIDVEVNDGEELITPDDLKSMELEEDWEDMSAGASDEDENDEVEVQQDENVEEPVEEDDANAPDTTVGSDKAVDDEPKDDFEFWTWGFMDRSITSSFKPLKLNEYMTWHMNDRTE